MNEVLKAFGRRVLRPVLGRRRWQRTFALLYELSLAGLNVGEGGHPAQSGERCVMDLVADRTRSREVVVFDVGANTGVYTTELLEALPGPARIFAFEPSRSTFRALESNLAGAIGVELRNLGFSDEERTATLYSPGEGSKLGSVYDTSDRLERVGMGLALQEEVELTTLDRFCSAEGIRHIDFLKLDVEGHELQVLHGAGRLLEDGMIDAIQFEFSAADVESRTFFKDFYDLLNNRYEIFRVLQDGLQPIEVYSEVHEVFKRATNYLALLRPSRHELQ